MHFQVDCNQQLGDIYKGTMELVEVSHCLSSKTRLLLNLNSVSSLGSATTEKVSEPFTRKHDPRLDGSDRTGSDERLRNCVLLDR